MVAKARDESDAAFDAYFYWLCDGSMSFGNMAGGGGGGGGIGRSGAGGANENWVGEYMYQSNVLFYGYTYNWEQNIYFSKYTGNVASYDEVYHNYIARNSSQAKDPVQVIKDFQKAYTYALFGISDNDLIAGPGISKNKSSITLVGSFKVTIGVQAGGNIDGIGGKYGLYGNLASITLIGLDGDSWIYPTSQRGGSTQISQGISGGFLNFGGGVTHTFDALFEGTGGYYNDSYSYQGGFKNGHLGIYYESTTNGNYINVSVNFKGAVILGIEGSLKLRIKLP